MATKKTATKKAPARKATTKSATAKKSTAKKSVAKKSKPTAARTKANGKKLSAIDAAATVLAGSKEAMNCKELIERLAAKKLWTSPGGKTPHATLYSAILREIAAKGEDARFQKTERGKFAANT